MPSSSPPSRWPARRSASSTRRDDAGFFEGKLSIRKRQPLRYRARNAGGEWWVTDPYSFGPVLGPMDDYYIAEGSHLRLFDKLGAHLHRRTRARPACISPSGRRTPSASRWSAISTTGTAAAIRCALRQDTGIWEIFVPDIGAGQPYKYEIVGAERRQCCR